MQDVQKTSPVHAYPIHRVGIRNLTVPIFIREKGDKIQHTVATVAAFVDLNADQKGTHMSRLAIGIHKFMDHKLDQDLLINIADYIKNKCEAETSHIVYKFPYFIKKLAPVSKEPGLIHTNVEFDLVKNSTDQRFIMRVESLTTSLCPCSKEISEAGAHNQRSKIKITCCPKKDSWIWIEDLIDIAERNASCQIYSSLKRTDEKQVTEEAYNNPKFVEDTVRGLYDTLISRTDVEWFNIEVINEESIHLHDAYASIDSRGDLRLI